MTGSLFVLCLAALALVSALVSCGTGLLLRVADWLALRMPPAHRAWWWLGLLAAPCALAVLALGLAFLPAFGLGHDHCSLHEPHHPHLCPHHTGEAPGIALVVAALLLGARVVYCVAENAWALRRGQRASQLLNRVTVSKYGAHVFEATEQTAFVLGVFRPRIYASSALFAQPNSVVDVVVAHERAHVERRDPLWRALGSTLAALHLPEVGKALLERLKAAQETSADLSAAASVPGGRLQVGEALVTLARLASSQKGLSAALEFAEGDLRARMQSLLNCSAQHWSWLPRAALLATIGGTAALALSASAVHHALETILGALS